jgi:hypothetical protein
MERKTAGFPACLTSAPGTLNGIDRIVDHVTAARVRNIANREITNWQ